VTRSTTRTLLAAATLFDGLLAGLNLDRSLVHNLAWRALGASAWAAYSQHADLAWRAAVLYPLLAFGGLTLGTAALVGFRQHASEPRAARLPVYAGVVLALGGLLMTFKAAPNMLRVPRVLDNPSALETAMDGFIFWGDVRGVIQVLAFVATLSGMAALVMAGSQLESTQRGELT